jgi:hypothetical protein
MAGMVITTNTKYWLGSILNMTVQKMSRNAWKMAQWIIRNWINLHQEGTLMARFCVKRC